LKDGRALRIETVFNDAYDLGCQRHLHDRDELQTEDGLAFAIIYTKVHNRVLRPLLAPTAPTAPRPLRAALRSIEQHVIADSPMHDTRRRLPDTLPKCNPSERTSLWQSLTSRRVAGTRIRRQVT
jgi:hypothetical protein